MKRFPSSLATTLSLALLPGAFAQTTSPASLKVSRDVASADPSTPLPIIIQYVQQPTAEDDLHLKHHGALVRFHLQSVRATAAQANASQVRDIASDPNVKYVSMDRPLSARQQVTVTGLEYTSEPINALPVMQSGYYGTGIGVAVIDSGINAVDDLSTLAARIAKAATPAATAPLAGPAAAAPAVPIVFGTSAATTTVVAALPNRIVYSASFVPGDSSTADAFGHGTHVAGLIAGNGYDSTGSAYNHTFVGTAPNANLINLRALDANGNGTDSSVIAALEAAIQLKSKYNIKVINLSLGRPIWESYQQDPLCQAVEQAYRAGITVVVAAGNQGRNLSMNPEGYGTVEAPGNDPYVLTVGAMKTMGTPAINDDLIASYSSKGPSFIDHISKPDIVAPGNLVSSLKFSNDPLAVNNPSFVTENAWYTVNGNTQASTSYYPLSGTSMAAGVVSGAVALMAQAYPALTPDQTKAFLMKDANKTVFPLTSSVTDPASGNVYNANYDVFTVGAGYLDLQATFNDLSATKKQNYPSGTAESPTAVYNSSTGQTTLVGADATILWGSSSTWAAGAIYGPNEVQSTVNGQTILWGSTILWGANDPSGFSQLNSSTILWGSGSPEAATILWGSSSPSSSSSPSNNTILWGSSSSSGNASPSSATILWGSSVPYED